MFVVDFVVSCFAFVRSLLGVFVFVVRVVVFFGSCPHIYIYIVVELLLALGSLGVFVVRVTCIVCWLFLYFFFYVWLSCCNFCSLMVLLMVCYGSYMVR